MNLHAEALRHPGNISLNNLVCGTGTPACAMAYAFHASHTGKSACATETRTGHGWDAVTEIVASVHAARRLVGAPAANLFG